MHILKRIIITLLVAGFACTTGVIVFVYVFSDMLINRYAKEKIEAVFTEAYPGYTLRIGRIHYNLLKNYTECQHVSLAAADSSLFGAAASISLSQIGWKQLVLQRELTPETVKRSVLMADTVVLLLARHGYEVHCAGMRISMPDSEITAGGVSMDFSESQYSFRCATFRVSVPDSEFSAEGIELRPLAGDEDFFAASAFRRTRARVTVAQCYLRGTDVAAMFKGKTYQARTLDLFTPEIDLLVNRDKASDPHAALPLMPGEALGRIGQALRLDTLSVHDANFVYGERVAADGKPGVINFSGVQLTAVGIDNSGRGVVVIRANGQFMNAGTMKLSMTMPLTRRDLSLSYTGSLSAMDGTVLNRFLETAEHTRITSCKLREAAFDVRIARGRGTGSVRMVYDDLYLTLLDKKTGSPVNLGNRIATLLANFIKIRGSNEVDKSGAVDMGKVAYSYKRGDTFMNEVWFSLRSGIGNVVGF